MADFSKKLPNIWFSGWSVVLALGWLLPNHYRPWTSFHSEAWVAIVLLVMACFAVWKAPSRFLCQGSECIVAFIAIVPMLQFIFGQIFYFGQAWLAFLYILGFFLALLSGRLLEASTPGRLVDLLSLAIGFASFFSVILQLYQWFGMDGLGLWLAEADPTAPSANLGQRNQLATLLLWGGLAILWGWVRASLGWQIALASAMLILFGIALTGSRTAWLGIFLVVVAVWYWRHLWRSRPLPWVVTGLAVYFFVCILGLKFIGEVNPTDVAQRELARAVGDSRLAAWKMFIGAAFERPYFGYGWGQIAEAHLSVATQYPAMNVVFAQSHNLFLDLVLWCGIPVGLFISGYLLYWFLGLFRQVSSQEKAVIFLFLLVMANHSMFELPLHYAYFLLPVGMLIGIMSASKQKGLISLILSKNLFTGLLVLGGTMLGITVVDYLRIENSYRILRMEWAGFNLEASPQPPKVIALNQWHHIIRQARVVPTSGMAESELAQLKIVAMQAHKPLDFRNIALALVLNGKSDEAELWIERLCRVDSESNCLMAKEEFAKARMH